MSAYLNLLPNRDKSLFSLKRLCMCMIVYMIYQNTNNNNVIGITLI